MSTILTLTKATMKMLVRNRQALFFTLFTPLLIMTILGLIGFDKAPSYDIGVASINPQPTTQQFIGQIKAFPIFKVHEGSLDAELTELRNGNRTVVIAIPSDFINLARAPQEMTVYINESQQGQAQAVTSILGQSLDKTSLALVHAPTFFTIRQEVIDSKHLKYIDFLLPGLIAMSVMQMSVFSVAFVFVQYKERGVLKRLLATPMKPFQFVTANVITRLTVSVIQAVIFLLVGVLLLKAHVIGSYFLVMLCVILGALMFLGLGFTISGLAKTVDSVPVFANLIVFPMLFLGGTFFDVSSMPKWLQTFSKLLPLTHFSGALRAVMTKAATFNDIKGDLGAMALWAVILIFLAIRTFSFQEKENV